MIYTMENTIGKKIKVYDNMGREIRFVTYYDTVTFEMEFMPTFVTDDGTPRMYSEVTEDGPRVKQVRTVWPGSYARIEL